MTERDRSGAELSNGNSQGVTEIHSLGSALSFSGKTIPSEPPRSAARSPKLAGSNISALLHRLVKIEP